MGGPLVPLDNEGILLKCMFYMEDIKEDKLIGILKKIRRMRWNKNVFLIIGDMYEKIDKKIYKKYIKYVENREMYKNVIKRREWIMAEDVLIRGVSMLERTDGKLKVYEML